MLQTKLKKRPRPRQKYGRNAVAGSVLFISDSGDRFTLCVRRRKNPYFELSVYRPDRRILPSLTNLSFLWTSRTITDDVVAALARALGYDIGKYTFRSVRDYVHITKSGSKVKLQFPGCMNLTVADVVAQDLLEVLAGELGWDLTEEA